MKQWPSGRRTSRPAPRGPDAGPPGGRLWGYDVAQGAALGPQQEGLHSLLTSKPALCDTKVYAVTPHL